MEADPFALFGLEPKFDVDLGDLERRYLALATRVHPDRPARADEPDPQAVTARINVARATLIDPERRASALLGVLGGPPAEREKSLPHDFLAEMMEVREAVDDALTGQDRARQGEWWEWCRQRRSAMIRDVGAAFAALGPRPTPSDLAAIRRQLNAWRYLERLRERLEE